MSDLLSNLSIVKFGGKKIPQHTFELVEGDNCNEFQGGSFKFSGRSRSGKWMKLVWFPVGFKTTNYEDINKLKKTHRVKFYPARIIPELLQTHIAGYKTYKQLAQMKSPEELAYYSKTYETLKSYLKKPVFEEFSDTELIGVWKGSFIDADEVIPVEMGLWPANVSGYQELMGIVLFEGNQCTVGLQLIRENGVVSIDLSREYIQVPRPECIMMEGLAQIKLHKSSNMLSVYLNPVWSKKNKSRGKNV